MGKIFLIQNSQNKDLVRLEVISKASVSEMEVKCKCDKTVKIKDYFGKCYNCGKSYAGPVLEK